MGRRKFGPKTTGNPSIGEICPACKQPFKVGDYTTLVALGPGDSEEGRARVREGRVYNAVAVECHWACVTGKEDEAR